MVVGYGALGQRCGGPSLTRGILSRALSWRSETIMLQTTCAVQAGTSGGAVVRVSSGELLGKDCLIGCIPNYWFIQLQVVFLIYTFGSYQCNILLRFYFHK